jgi:TldD protein
MKYLIRAGVLSAMLLLTGIKFCYSQDFILDNLKKELNFQIDKYKADSNKPYFIQFNVIENRNYKIKCSMGSLISSDHDFYRAFTPEIRIGSYALDNTHQNESNPFAGMNFGKLPVTYLATEDSVFQFSRSIRKTTENEYKSTLESFTENNKHYIDKPVKSHKDDFDHQKPNVYYEKPLTFSFDKNLWENKLKQFTDYFKKSEFIESADANLIYVYNRQYIVNTEGSSIVQNNVNTQIVIAILIKCSDNNMVPLYRTYSATTLEGLPSDSALIQQAHELLTLALQLKDAPMAEAYSGPCILSSTASGVFFHEIFGHRVEGHRLNSKMDAQTFKNKTGSEILPSFLSITYDPSQKKYNNADLFGYYKFDDQAVSSQPVEVIKDGKLTNFLMCRTPIDSIHSSNGHGRGSLGYPIVSRQSNMFVTSSKTLTEIQLKQQLIKTCKKEKLKYGLYFKEVIGGFTATSSLSPNYFSVIPTIVYRIYTDGRPDELVKGVSLIGTPLSMFSEITSVGDEITVNDGYCGAESGYIPVSTISPSILVSKIETQKTFEIKNETFQLSRPDISK